MIVIVVENVVVVTEVVYVVNFRLDLEAGNHFVVDVRSDSEVLFRTVRNLKVERSLGRNCQAPPPQTAHSPFHGP